MCITYLSLKLRIKHYFYKHYIQNQIWLFQENYFKNKFITHPTKQIIYLLSQRICYQDNFFNNKRIVKRGVIHKYQFTQENYTY